LTIALTYERISARTSLIFNDNAVVAAGDERGLMLCHFKDFKEKSTNYVASPMQIRLVFVEGKYVSRKYAKVAAAAGIKIITGTLERPGPLGGGAKSSLEFLRGRFLYTGQHCISIMYVCVFVCETHSKLKYTTVRAGKSCRERAKK
jgi:hypothetical protein